MLRDIFAIAIQPLLKMIGDFIYTGQFDDPFEEFFVEKVSTSIFKLTENANKIP
jgi:hypothetical protein